MRAPTRGCIASVLHEFNQATGFGINMNEADAPVRDEVLTICDILGYESYYLANEGRVVSVVDENIAEQVLSIWKKLPNGEQTSIVGEITEQHQQVVLQTELGVERIMQELSDTPLPRIC